MSLPPSLLAACLHLRTRLKTVELLSAFPAEAIAHRCSILARCGDCTNSDCSVAWTVSGGSIFSAFLATAMVKRSLSNAMDFPDWENDVAKPFREFTSNDIRTLPVLLHCLWNWIWPAPRLKQLESTCHSQLTSLTLAQLPERPRFILCATDLTFGVNWEFGRGYAGDYQVGYRHQLLPGRWLVLSLRLPPSHPFSDPCASVRMPPSSEAATIKNQTAQRSYLVSL